MRRVYTLCTLSAVSVRPLSEFLFIFTVRAGSYHSQKPQKNLSRYTTDKFELHHLLKGHISWNGFKDAGLHPNYAIHLTSVYMILLWSRHAATEAPYVETLRKVCKRRAGYSSDVRPRPVLGGDHNGLVHVELVLKVLIFRHNGLSLTCQRDEFLSRTCHVSSGYRKMKGITNVFCLCQFSSYTVDIHDALCRIVMAQNLRVEFTQMLGLLFCKLVTSYEGSYLI
jgi:hypothetical protein